MKVLGTATVLATGTTKFNTSTSVYVFNTDTSAGVCTVRNTTDNADIGTIYIGAGAGVTIDLEIGQGLRGTTSMYGTQIAASGY
jgi:hypothetical protein